ncbi:MAG: Hsp20/alpha crystallin family protein [Planctomycetota bacterium]
MTTCYRSPVDIYETDTGYEIHADVPGVRCADLEVDVDHDQLRIGGTTPAPEGQEPLARWERRFHLNQPVDREAVEATLEDGILRLVLPKPQEVQPRRIAVRAG